MTIQSSSQYQKKEKKITPVITIYLKNSGGQHKLDRNGHLIVDHDLHNHDGELENGIAEAFIEFAKNEKLSFWR